jgi:hypothetical protein
MVAAGVARRDLDFGLARMWQAFVDGNGWETMIFRSQLDAARWIEESTVQRPGDCTD